MLTSRVAAGVRQHATRAAKRTIQTTTRSAPQGARPSPQHTPTFNTTTTTAVTTTPPHTTSPLQYQPHRNISITPQSNSHRADTGKFVPVVQLSEHELYGVQQTMTLQQEGQRRYSNFQMLALLTFVGTTFGAAYYYFDDYRYNIIKPIVSFLRPIYIKHFNLQSLYTHTTPHSLSKVHSAEFHYQDLEDPLRAEACIKEVQRVVLKEIFKLYQYYDDISALRHVLPDLAPVPSFKNDKDHQLQINDMRTDYLEVDKILYKALTTGFFQTLTSEYSCLYNREEILTKFRKDLIKGLQEAYQEDLIAYETKMHEDDDRYQSSLKTRTPQGSGLHTIKMVHSDPNDPNSPLVRADNLETSSLTEAHYAKLMGDEVEQTNNNNQPQTNLNTKVPMSEAQYDQLETDRLLTNRLKGQGKKFRVREQMRQDRALYRELMPLPTPPTDLIAQLEVDDNLVLKHYVNHMATMLHALHEQAVFCESLMRELDVQFDQLKAKHIKYERQQRQLQLLEVQELALKKAMEAHQKSAQQSMEMNMNSNRPTTKQFTVNGMSLAQLEKQREDIGEPINEYDFKIDAKPLMALYNDSARSYQRKLISTNLREFWELTTKYPDQLYSDIDLISNDDGTTIPRYEVEELRDNLTQMRNFLVQEELLSVYDIPLHQRKPPIESIPEDKRDTYVFDYWGLPEVELIHQLSESGLTDLKVIQATQRALNKMLMEHHYAARQAQLSTKGFVRVASPPLMTLSDTKEAAV